MPVNWGFSIKLCSSFLEASSLSKSAASTIYLDHRQIELDRWNRKSDLDLRNRFAYTIALTPRQYLSHIERNLGWPPISHTLMVTLPLVIFLILNPTVGIVSWLNWPDLGYKAEISKRYHIVAIRNDERRILI